MFNSSELWHLTQWLLLLLHRGPVAGTSTHSILEQCIYLQTSCRQSDSALRTWDLNFSHWCYFSTYNAHKETVGEDVCDSCTSMHLQAPSLSLKKFQND